MIPMEIKPIRAEEDYRAALGELVREYPTSAGIYEDEEISPAEEAVRRKAGSVPRPAPVRFQRRAPGNRR